MLSTQELEGTANCSLVPTQTLIKPKSKETGYLSQMKRLIISCFPIKIVKSFSAKTISLEPIRNKELSVEIVSILQNEEARISTRSTNDIKCFGEKLKAYSNDKLSNTLEELKEMRNAWSRAGVHLCSDPAGGFHHYMWAYLAESSE